MFRTCLLVSECKVWSSAVAEIDLPVDEKKEFHLFEASSWLKSFFLSTYFHIIIITIHRCVDNGQQFMTPYFKPRLSFIKLNHFWQSYSQILNQQRIGTFIEHRIKLNPFLIWILLFFYAVFNLVWKMAPLFLIYSEWC